MSLIRRSAIVLSLALFFVGPEANTPPARGGEWSAEYRAGLQRTVEKRRERRRAKVERHQAFLEAQRQAKAAQAAIKEERRLQARGKGSGDDYQSDR
jgi:hypothetical protein